VFSVCGVVYLFSVNEQSLKLAPLLLQHGKHLGTLLEASTLLLLERMHDALHVCYTVDTIRVLIRKRLRGSCSFLPVQAIFALLTARLWRRPSHVCFSWFLLLLLLLS
jgi:hypothetical protein